MHGSRTSEVGSAAAAAFLTLDFIDPVEEKEAPFISDMPAACLPVTTLARNRGRLPALLQTSGPGCLLPLLMKTPDKIGPAGKAIHPYGPRES